MMMYVMHHAFRRDLTRFAAAAAATPADDHGTGKALHTRWTQFGEILHHHHSGEDAGIWPYLLERADADERATLEAMEEEHSRIDPLLQGCAGGFAELAGDRAGRTAADLEDVRAALQVRVAATRDALSRHLHHEESEAMVILQRHMTQEDWEKIADEHFEKGSPEISVFFMVGWCAEAVPAAALKEIFATVGRPFQVIWWLTRGRFRRGERRAFRYAGV
jgi:iron-sulfur cluster repair protein YtfE (RIC family)